MNEEKCPYCGRPRPGMWGLTPALRGLDVSFVDIILWSCGLIYIATLAVDPSQLFGGGLFSFLSPTGPTLFLFGSSGAMPLFGADRWWTVLSATWLHGSLLHIGFNMMWVRDLGRLTGQAYGAGRMMIIYTVAGIVGFFLSSLVGAFLPFMPSFLRGATMTVGASASLFGLLGALIYAGRRGAGSAALNQQVINWAVILFVFGLLMPQVDNWAHLGGFLGGYVMGRFFDPMKPERTDHLLIGILCLVASAGAVILSIVTGLPILRQQGLL
ncbi:MAG: rhomboid family intramembrane serine protease [Acidobacteriota bacterium]|nr:rhomboid family intramembrane serine protease [Acidobacteriota bacterium]